MKDWLKVLVLRALWIAFSFGFFCVLAIAQDAPKESPKLVERYDVAHMKSFAAPVVFIHNDPDGQLVHVTCQIAVYHDNNTVYRQTPYDGLVDPSNDVDLAFATTNAYKVCGDRLTEILLDFNKYQRALANTVSAKRK